MIEDIKIKDDKKIIPSTVTDCIAGLNKTKLDFAVTFISSLALQINQILKHKNITNKVVFYYFLLINRCNEKIILKLHSEWLFR